MRWVVFLGNSLILTAARVLKPSNSRNFSSKIDFIPEPHDVGPKERIVITEEDDGHKVDMSQLLLLGKFEYGGGPIFKVVLEC